MPNTAKPDGRTESIRIRVTTAEKQTLADLAWKARKTVSDYMRDAVLTPTSKGDKKR